MNDAEVKLQVKIDDTQVNKATDRMTSRLDKLSKGFNRAGKILTAGLTLPIAGLIATGVKYNATVEDLTTSFKVMTGSATKASKIVERLKNIGSKTPFEFTGLAEVTKLLMNYGLTADDAIDKMMMLGDISQGNAEKMNRISMAYGQMSSAGKVHLQDVKQMIEAGFNPLKEISETTGESMSSLYDRISKGTISVDEITASMKRSTSVGGKYFKSMEEQAKTTTGKLSTLKDEFLNATGTLTESLIPTFQKLIDLLTQLSTWFSNLSQEQKDTVLKALAVVAGFGPLLIIISKIIVAVGVVGTALAKLGPIFLVLKNVALAVAGGVATAGGAIAIAIGSVVAAIIWAIWYIRKNFEAFKTGLQVIFKAIINALIWNLNKAISLINGFVKLSLVPINGLIAALNLIPGVKLKPISLKIPKIPSLDVGTNYVGQDGLAFLHKGEAVVPKKYNPSYMGSTQTIVVQPQDIYLDGAKIGRTLTPQISRNLRLAGV